MAGAAAIAFVPALSANAQSRPRVVIVGGGVGGATAAKDIRLLAGNAIDVSIVSGSETYYPPFAIHAFKAPQGCAVEPVTVSETVSNAGVSVVPLNARRIETGKRRVVLDSSGTGPEALEYDILIAAPGVALNWDGVGDVRGSRRDPLWIANASCADVLDLFKAVPEGGRLAITAPSGGHRCPPAVYERACLGARWFKQHNPTATILLIDDKDSYPLQAQFETAYADYYEGVIEWVPRDFHGGIESVDFDSGAVVARDETFKADVLNVIPPQTAARILAEAGLTDESGYAPIDATTMRSAIDENIYVIGDAASVGELSKSAHAAQVEARLAACDIVLRLLQMKVEERIQVSDTCWSTVAPDDAVYMAATYEAAGTGFKTVERTTSDVDDDATLRQQNAAAAAAWRGKLLQALYGPH